MVHDVSDHELNLLPPADWAGEIERLEESIRLERDRNLRTLADFKNYRRRQELEGNTIARQNTKGMLLSLLEIVDDIEKALHSSTGGQHSSMNGVKLIHQKFLAFLASNGVVPFDSAGVPFSHELHEALAMADDRGSDAGTVVDELRRGYLWNNELLRAAQVCVAGQ